MRPMKLMTAFEKSFVCGCQWNVLQNRPIMLLLAAILVCSPIVRCATAADAITILGTQKSANLVPNHINGIKTVFLILMENHNWDAILGNPFCPYINDTLLPMASYCDQYYSPPGNHPSEPNYLWLIAGTNFGIHNDSPPSFNYQSSTNTLFHLLDQTGISWKTYQEDISGTNCPLTNDGPYAVRHNPFVFFDEVLDNLDYCLAHIRPYSELAGDLDNHTVARFNFISPNVTNDMHDLAYGSPSSAQQGDQWLAHQMPKLLGSSAYQDGGLIMILWDEGTGSRPDGPIGLIALSPRAKGGGYHNDLYYTHSSTLRTVQSILGVRPFLGEAANANDLSDLFKTIRLTSAEWRGTSFVFGVTNVIPGKTNYVQISTHLGANDWTTIQTNVPDTDFETVTDHPPAATSPRFYRVVELP